MKPIEKLIGRTAEPAVITPAMLETKEYLDELCARFNCSGFIEADPISIPHSFTQREDIEISAFLASTIAWGQRPTIVRNANRMVDRMDRSPHQFILNATHGDMQAAFGGFVHRTFNDQDFIYFAQALARIYREDGGLKAFFESQYADTGDMRIVLSRFWHTFFSDPNHPRRAERHLSSIDKGAACKRLNMFLKWMVRRDAAGVDFGIWDGIPACALYLPLDVHSANTSRALGLLHRAQNDWRAVEQITAVLRAFDPKDPVRYDFALFSAGIHKVL